MGAIHELILGDSGVSITQLGFGCARLFAGSELRSSANLVEVALANGIRHFDTAPSYSWGQSEEVLAEVLKGVTDATIATKVGLAQTTSGPSALSSLYRRTLRPLLAAAPGLKSAFLRAVQKPQHHQTLRPRRMLSPEEVEKSLSGSLARLRRDRLDVLLIHEPEHLTIGDDIRELLEGLRLSGVIRSYGLAWGGQPDGRTLGQVAQKKFLADPLEGLARGHTTTVFHGVIRSLQQPATKPAARVANVCAAYPNCGVVFSASSPSQIREIATAVDERRQLPCE